ncbi:MAG: HAMP domain-containing protein [Planctomycetes bacterium]|nr:HAMP domain-containing protein [Planctomycetota bacterium]
MRLGTRLALVLVGVVGCYALVDFALQRRLLVPSFAKLEIAEAERAVERVEQALGRELAHLERETGTLAARPPERWPLAEELDAAALHVFVACAPDGRVETARLVDPHGGGPIVLRDFPTGALSTSHWIFSPLRPGAPASGLWPTERGILLVAARSSGDDASGRRLIAGRFLDTNLIARLGETTRSSVAFWPLDPASLPEEERAVADRVTATNELVTRVTKPGTLRAYGALDDARGQPGFLCAVDLPQAISAHGEVTGRYALISTLASGLLLVLVLMLSLRRIVVGPLARLTEHAEAIGASDDLSRRLVVDRADEIGTLSREFDAMVGKLARSRQQVVETARAAGMSEIATGILHNVGNVLNSVNVAHELASTRVRESKSLLLEKLAGVVSERGADLSRWIASDAQGQRFAPFLLGLTKQISEERAVVVSELETLGEGIRHIRTLVDAQQAYATNGRLEEPVELEPELRRAIQLTESAPGAAKNVDVRVECTPGLVLHTDRHRLLDVLVNVVQNARQALAERCDGRPTIVLRASAGPSGIACIEIEDNGVGIAPEHMPQLFRHGFTTKRIGHGFGLHASANAATQLGGRISARSDGPGRGAVFTLELPGRESVARAA